MAGADPAENGRLDEALGLMGEGRHADAIPLLEAILRNDPRVDQAWETLAWAWRHQERLDRAREVLDDWRRLAPPGTVVHEQLASLATAQNRLDDAATHLRQALEIEPGRPDLRFRLAQILRWTGRLTDAIRIQRELHAEDPEDPEVRLELARALLSNWEFEEAALLWARVLADNPGDFEARLADAQASLHTGRRRGAELSARRLLAENPTLAAAWQILADAAQYDDRLEDALPALQQWMALTEDRADRDYLFARILAIRSRLHERDPRGHPLSEALDHARVYAAEFRSLPYAQLALAELLTRSGRLLEAREIFLRVLREDNQRSLRSERGLFEVALGLRHFEEAETWLDRVRSFNPRDPYLAHAEARLCAARGDFRGARAALARLDAAGTRGATAILLYHALTASPFGPALHVEQFRDHVRALLTAGYTFLTPDLLHAHWDSSGEAAGRFPDGRVRREVIITFDDGLENTHRFGTSVALDYGIQFTQHIAVGNVVRGDAYISSWDELREYLDTGAWVFGSHLLFASDPASVTRDGLYAHPMSSRIWLAEEDRLETEQEFFRRIREEYERSQALIREHLGVPSRFVAYPYGDIGQEVVSNMPEAVYANLNHARTFYEIGFIQVPYAHAVRCDDPLLYGRNEMDITATGQETVDYLIDRHPVFLAGRMRFNLALEEGRAARARAVLDRLRADGYPLSSIRVMEERMRPGMARAFSVPDLDPPTGTMDPAPLGIRSGVEARVYRNRLDARHMRGLVHVDVLYAPHLQVRAEAGAGTLRQAPEAGGPAAAVDEGLGLVTVSWVGDDRTVVSVGGGWRELEGSARDGVALGMVEVHGRVSPALDLRFRLDRDGMDEAAALARGITRNRWLAHAVWEPTDGWTVGAHGQHEAISDRNHRTSIRIEPVYWGEENTGWRMGAAYGLTQSDREMPDYWTPESLHTVQVLIGHRTAGTLGTIDVTAQAGWGRERAHPSRDEPSVNRGWRPAMGASAWWAFPFGSRFGGGIDAGFSRSPEYDELRAGIRGTYRF